MTDVVYLTAKGVKKRVRKKVLNEETIYKLFQLPEFEVQDEQGNVVSFDELEPGIAYIVVSNCKSILFK